VVALTDARGMPRRSNRNVLHYVVDSDYLKILFDHCYFDSEAYRRGFVWSNITNRPKQFCYFQ